MTFSIRPFTPDDFEAAARVGTAALDYPFDPVQMRYNLEHSAPECKHRQWIAIAGTEADGRVIGYASFDQWEGQYHPRKFSIDVWVHPSHQRQGIGTALYNTLMDALEPFEPLSVAAEGRESHPEGMQFLASHGFTESMRAWQSNLDLDAFDPTPYYGIDDQLQDRGITLHTYADLAADPERDQKLFDLISTTRVDMPSTEPFTPLEFASWAARLHENPDLLPQYYLIAVQGDRYVGLSVLWRSQDAQRLNTGFTGVRRECRHQGVALALKVRVLAGAKATGYKQVITFNAQVNRAMLGINERLGFVKTPAWIEYTKVLRPE